MNSRYFAQSLIIFTDSNIVLALINDKWNGKAGEQEYICFEHYR